MIVETAWEVNISGRDEGNFPPPRSALFGRQSGEIALNEKLFLCSPPFLDLDLPATDFDHSRIRLFENQFKISMGFRERGAVPSIVRTKAFF